MRPIAVRSAVVAAMFLFAVAACGGSPTAEPAAGPAEAAATATAALAGVEAQLAGLGPEERRAELTRLAQAEGGEVSFYGSTTPDDADPVFEAFEDATDITVNNYRGSGSNVMQRLFEESDAGFAGADVVILGGPNHEQLRSADLLASFTTPVAEQIFEGGVTEQGISVYRTIRVQMWNTDQVTPDQVPATWEDLFTKFPGQVVLEPGDWDWFATFTQLYLMGEKGMSEQQAIDWWIGVAPNTAIVDGHTLGTQLVTTGEYLISAVTYHHSLPPADAPVGWEPPLWPVVADSAKIGIMASSPRPASALLLTEFFLTDGQQILYEGGRSPANTTVQSSWPSGYDELTVDVVDLFSAEGEAEKWQDLYEEVLSHAGGGSS